MSAPRVCIHGALRRQCETCDLADDVERLERELAAATQRNEQADPVVLPISLRDYFAAAALQGVLACTATSVSVKGDETYPEAWARAAFEYADAMLAEREK